MSVGEKNFLFKGGIKMKKLILLTVLICCFVRCGQESNPIRSNYFDEGKPIDPELRRQSAAGTYMCLNCNWIGLAKLEGDNKESYVCPKCGKLYTIELHIVGELSIIIIIPEQEPIP